MRQMIEKMAQKGKKLVVEVEILAFATPRDLAHFIQQQDPPYDYVTFDPMVSTGKHYSRPVSEILPQLLRSPSNN